MSTTFENTPLVIGQQATTFGEMRRMAAETQQQTTAETVMATAMHNPALLASAIRGLCETVKYLIDTIEEARENDSE